MICASLKEALGAIGGRQSDERNVSSPAEDPHVLIMDARRMIRSVPELAPREHVAPNKTDEVFSRADVQDRALRPVAPGHRGSLPWQGEDKFLTGFVSSSGFHGAG
jgi:hypothetical protein